MPSILPLPPGVVGEFIGQSHKDLARVTELLNQYPTLLHAAFDWGNGDWETALGAAAHTGRKDIAQFLITRGARIDIFAAATLGRLALVRAFISENPAIIHVAGPHGIPLIDHARKGGNAEVIALLNRLLHPERKKLAGQSKPVKSRSAAKARVARLSRPKRRKAA